MDAGDIDLQTDLESAMAALEEEPRGPEFALATNQFHRVKAEEKNRRRGIKKWIRPENALALLPHLPTNPDERTHAILRGDFVLCDIIPAIIRERGRCPHLHIATLGMSGANAETLASLHQAGLIGEITICCSIYFRQVDRTATWPEVERHLGAIAKLIVSRNHAKVICLPTESGDLRVAWPRGQNHHPLEGEVDERVTVSAMVDQAARRVAGRVLEEVEIEEELLVAILRSAIEEEILEARLSTTRTMLRYFWQGARSPWDAMKALLATTRLVASHLIAGASQTDVAFVLRETKGATRAREKRKVEDLLKAWGVQGFHLEGGQKSESARAIYAEVQKGNRNRAKDKSKPRKRK